MRIPIRILTFLGAAAILLATRSGADHPPAVHAQAMIEQRVDYGCSGRPEPFSVPPGVTQLTIEAEGAAGSDSTSTGGHGGVVRGTLAVTPGDLLTIEVGCRNGYGHIRGGAGGSSAVHAGGSGGGATGIRNAFEPGRVPGLLLVAAAAAVVARRAAPVVRGPASAAAAAGVAAADATSPPRHLPRPSHRSPVPRA
ncbi:MAG: glycine-rich protein [Dehalococcoidia bacterium]